MITTMKIIMDELPESNEDESILRLQGKLIAPWNNNQYDAGFCKVRVGPRRRGS